MKESHRLILDVDTGEDDAIALLLAVQKKLPVSHVITSYGNTTLENATKNTADILHLAHAHTIQVVQGSSRPLKNHPFEESTAMAGDFVGKNGLCGITLKANTSVTVHTPSADRFEHFMEQILCQQQYSTYIITGPQTN